MNVLITGGTGLIGRALAHQLLQSGYQVSVLTRSAAPGGLEAGIVPVVWDGCTTNGWEKAAADAGAIINLAGENIGGGRWTKERKERILQSRIDAGNAVAAAVQAGARPEVLIQASAVGYYGTSFTETYYERSKAGRDFLAHICLDWEASSAAVDALGVRRVVVRTGIVLDKREGALARMLLPFRLFAGGPLGSGRQWMSWIHLQDEVNAIQYLLEHKDAKGAYNLTAPQPVTNSHFGRALGKVLNRPYWFPVPEFAMKTLLGEMSVLVLEGQRVLPQRLESAGFKFKFDQLQPALEDLFPPK